MDDLVSILDKIYDNPYYRHMHPDPTLAIANLEEPLQVKCKERGVYTISLLGIIDCSSDQTMGSIASSFQGRYQGQPNQLAYAC